MADKKAMTFLDMAKTGISMIYTGEVPNTNPDGITNGHIMAATYALISLAESAAQIAAELKREREATWKEGYHQGHRDGLEEAGYSVEDE